MDHRCSIRNQKDGLTSGQSHVGAPHRHGSSLNVRHEENFGRIRYCVIPPRKAGTRMHWWHRNHLLPRKKEDAAVYEREAVPGSAGARNDSRSLAKRKGAVSASHSFRRRNICDEDERR